MMSKLSVNQVRTTKVHERLEARTQSLVDKFPYLEEEIRSRTNLLPAFIDAVSEINQTGRLGTIPERAEELINILLDGVREEVTLTAMQQNN